MHLPCVIALVMFKKQGRICVLLLVCGIMKNAPAMCNSTAGREFCGILWNFVERTYTRVSVHGIYTHMSRT